jgi:predicted alternative tryptophan synthase beta-subunit
MTVGFARYTKVGNLVTVTGNIVITAVSGSGSDFTIAGLPFANSANSMASGTFGLQDISTAPNINIGYGSTSLGFYNQLTPITEANVIGKQFTFSITYSTTN